MAFEGRHVLLDLFASDEASIHQFVTNIVDEVSQDRSPIMARRIDMDDRIDIDVHHPGITKQTMRAPTDEEVDPLSCRIGFIRLE